MQREGNEQCDLPLLLFLGSRTNSKRCSPRIPESKVDLCHNPTSWSHLANNFCLQLGERHLNYSRFLKTNATKPCLKASAKFCCLIANATLEGKRGATKKNENGSKSCAIVDKNDENNEANMHFKTKVRECSRVTGLRVQGDRFSAIARMHTFVHSWHPH